MVAYDFKRLPSMMTRGPNQYSTMMAMLIMMMTRYVSADSSALVLTNAESSTLDSCLVSINSNLRQLQFNNSGILCRVMTKTQKELPSSVMRFSSNHVTDSDSLDCSEVESSNMTIAQLVEGMFQLKVSVNVLSSAFLEQSVVCAREAIPGRYELSKAVGYKINERVMYISRFVYDAISGKGNNLIW